MTEDERTTNDAASKNKTQSSITPVNEDREFGQEASKIAADKQREDTVHLPPINQNAKVPSQTPCHEIPLQP